MIILLVILAIVYLIPGAFLARGIYSDAIREINGRTPEVIPKCPPKPRMEIEEMLHTVRCSAVVKHHRVCNCKAREEWLDLKYEWYEFNTWKSKYSNRDSKEPEVPDPLPIYGAVVFWPVVMIGLFIKGGAKKIPDYRAIERLENEMKELQ